MYCHISNCSSAVGSLFYFKSQFKPYNYVDFKLLYLSREQSCKSKKSKSILLFLSDIDFNVIYCSGIYTPTKWTCDEKSIFYRKHRWFSAWQILLVDALVCFSRTRSLCLAFSLPANKQS